MTMKNMTRVAPGGKQWLVALSFVLMTIPAHALEALSNSEMAAVNGRDGLAVELSDDVGITADQVTWTLDRGALDGSGDPLQNSIRIGKAGVAGDGFSLSAINPGGAAPDHAMKFGLTTDAYVNDQGRPGVGVRATWNRLRARIDSMSVSDDTRSFGTLALDSQGQFELLGDDGLFNINGNNASLLIDIGNVDASDPDPSNWTIADPGQLFYRMDGPGGTEARLDELGFLFHMPDGSVGVDSNGLVVSSAAGTTTDLNLTFDVVANADSSFQTSPSNDLPMLFFGWRGGLENFDFRLGPGGVWLSDGSTTEGVTTSLGFDLADNFQFVVGEGGDDRSFLEFTNPQSLPRTLAPSRKDVEFGSLTLDAVSAGQGAGGICYGGGNTAGPLSGCSADSFASLPAQIIDLPPTEDGVALIARDWGLHAYSSQVSYRDGVDPAFDVDNEGWALIYTLGDISSNLYLYPVAGGGISMDATTVIQTLGTTNLERWENGTHLMIGDTDKNMGIGLVGSDLLFAARDMDINLSIAEGGLRFYSDVGVRLQLRGMFSGGDIPNMQSPVNGSYVDMNFEFDEFAFNVLPDIINTDYLAFGGYFSFADLDNGFSNQTGGDHGHDDGSYFSMAEPDFGKLNVDLRLADITGDIEVPVTWNQGGRIDLISGSGTPDGKPRLRIEAKMNVGGAATSPGGAQGSPLRVGRVEFGGSNLGTIVMPTARVYSAITLKQQ